MSYYAVEAEHASRLQYGRYSLRITGSNLLVISNGSTEQIFDLSSFIVTPFDPSGTMMTYPYPTDSGVTIDVTTLYEAMRLMSEYIVGLHSASENAFSDLRTITKGFNSDGTELNISKLNGYRTYESVGGASQAIPGPAPWIVGVREDGVAEVGRIIDFHTSYITGTNDVTCRLTCTGNNTLSVINFNVSSVLSGPTISGLTTRMIAEETKSGTLRTDVDGLTTRMTAEETKSGTLRTDVDGLMTRMIDEETKSGTLRTDVDGLTTRMIAEETLSGTFQTNIDGLTTRMIAEETLSGTLRTDVDGLTTRMIDEETKSGTLRTDVDGLTTRMSSAEGTIANHCSLISNASSSAAAVNARVTRIMGTYFFPNGYDDPNNSDFRTLEWVVDYMLKNVIPSLGELETSNTLQSWLLGLLGAANVAEVAYMLTTLKTLEAASAAHGVQLSAHAITLEANLLTMAELQADAALAKTAIGLHATQIASVLFLSGAIGVGIYAMINRKNGPMKAETPVPNEPPKYVPITNDNDPVALIGYSDPVARVINEIAYELADARLIRFEETYARIDPILKVDSIIVETLNGVSPSDYALVSSLSDYVSIVAFTNTLYNYATKTKVDSISTRVATIEGDYALASSLSDYALTSSLSNYALTSSLSNYATISSLNTLSGRVSTVESKTTSLSYEAAATTISNTLRLTTGMAIDPSNSLVWFRDNIRVDRWIISPWANHVNDALILLDHVNTSAYSNSIRIMDGRLYMLRHPGAWSHGVYIDIELIHFGTEQFPQVANISYTSYNIDGDEPHAREPRLALVTHTASSKQYIAIHVPFYLNSGRLYFAGIISTLTESMPLTMVLPSDGYVIDESPYTTYSRKYEMNHDLRCGNIESPTITNLFNSVDVDFELAETALTRATSAQSSCYDLAAKTVGLNSDGTELTITKLNGLNVSEYVTDGSLQFQLNGYVPLGDLDGYALTSVVDAISGRVTTVESKTSKLSYTSLMDLLTMNANITLSKFMIVNGTTDGSVSISCPNGKIVSENVTSTNKDDIDSLKTEMTTVESKTNGFNSDGTELTISKLNGLNVSEYASTTSLNAVSGRVTTVESKTNGLNSDGTELTISKLNGCAFYSGTSGSGIPAAPWIPIVKNDGVIELGRIIDFHTDYVTGGTDYTCRVKCTGNSLSIPNIATNSVTASGTVSGSNITTITNKVTALETKTTGLSYSSGTTVFDTVPKIGTESLIDLIYPIGTVYQSTVSSFNPNTKWGGTWVKMEGVFILGSSSTHSVGDTGGSAKATIEGRHLPDHTHPYEAYAVSFVEEKLFNSVMDTTRVYANGSSTFVRNTSGWKSTSQIDQLDILPPYEVVNIWKRTA